MRKFLLFLFLILIFPDVIYAKQGCCSWHGGVSHCGSNGRYVCNDGTYSPSCACTPSVSYKYGCTNRDALNYDYTANRDDGSCIYRIYGCMNTDAINYNLGANTSDGSCLFEEEIVDEVEILYEIIVEKGQKNEIKQKGSNGQKRIITKNIKDELGNIISSEVVEDVIVEPINEIKVEKLEPVFEEKQVEGINGDYYDEEEADVGVNGLSFLFAILLTIFGVYKLKN